MSPNVVGHVTEFVEDKDPNTFEPKIQLKLKIRNTLGEEVTIWVDGPAYLSDFFAASKAKDAS